jgi:hypothetical protein
MSSSLSFTMENNTTFIVKGNYKKEVTKDLFLEMLQLTLAHVSPSRDYSSVSSINKLLKIVELECEPDESDSEEVEPEPVVVEKTVKQQQVKQQVKQPAKQTGKQPIKKDESSEDESDDD